MYLDIPKNERLLTYRRRRRTLEYQKSSERPQELKAPLLTGVVPLDQELTKGSERTPTSVTRHSDHFVRRERSGTLRKKDLNTQKGSRFVLIIFTKYVSFYIYYIST